MKRESRADMTPVQRMQADAAEDYAAANTPEAAAAARAQRCQAQVNGNAAAGCWHGARK